jgi:putative glutamine amidotransferase
MKPLVGITPSPVEDQMPHGRFVRYAMAAPYVEAVLAAGGVPIVLPPQDGNGDALLDAVDALLLSGGGDVEPARYGDVEVHPAVYGVSPLRDRFELELAAGALARDLPLLCICRGLQLLNVALGGTLIQDVADQHDAPVRVQHRQHEDGLPSDAVGHELAVAPDSLLARVFGSKTVGVNSFHHQAIKALAPTLVPNARAADGLIEAVSLPETTFVLGVQWHPELMFERHPEQLRPFTALVEAALARKLTGSAV